MMTTELTEDRFGKRQARDGVSNRRLWLQLAMSALAWIGLGVADMLITWRACLNEEQFGSASVHSGAHALYFVVTGLLFVLAVLTGVSSYRTWRKLSGAIAFLDAEGRERSEFMSQAAVFISFTLGFGMIWFFIPLFLIQMCLRTR
jgi:hypothetical protein